jgi:serine/threonine protein kinase
LLHNKLIGDIEFALKGKMAYQAAKGMHFLHSSGIVHRDLKSLNLLLDAKWNVKVSDFGLTKFKADLDRHENNNRGSGARDPLGSVHWMAPEVLAESPGVDFALADVYSFGVILWELLTRREPYQGMTYANTRITALIADVPNVCVVRVSCACAWVCVRVSCRVCGVVCAGRRRWLWR